MGHTRDDRQAIGLATSDAVTPQTSSPQTPYVGRRRATITVPPSPVAQTAPYLGKRRAAVVAPETAPATALEPSEQATPYVGRRRAVTAEPARTDEAPDTGTIQRVLAELEPIDQTTSFAGEDTVMIPLQLAGDPGRRRAARQRSGVLSKVPSVPVLVGVAAMAISVAGVVSTTSSEISPVSQARIGSFGALNGADAIGSVRPGVVSRDSDRDALADAAGGGLEAQVEAQAEQRDAALSKLAAQAEERAGVLAENRWVLPLSGYRLTAVFGEYGLWSSYHTGLDFAADSGTQLLAVARGVITSTGYDGAYGNKTVLTLEDGTEVWYAHQSSIYASVGDIVAPGDVIGTVGSTGNVTGAHLHLEVRPGGGDPVDPRAALIANGVTP